MRQMINREIATKGKKYLEKAIAILGSRTILALHLKVSDKTVNYWMWQQYLPATYIHRVETLTKGKVTAKQLRPDLF